MDRLAGLTLLTAGDGIVMHPWTAALVTRNTEADLRPQHERALAMRSGGSSRATAPTRTSSTSPAT